MKCATTRLRKNKRQQFCLLQDSLEKNIMDEKSLYRLIGNLYQKFEETNISELSNNKKPHIRLMKCQELGVYLEEVHFFPCFYSSLCTFL